MILRIAIKLTAALVIGLFSWSLITAEVVSAPPGTSPDQYNEQLKSEGRPGRLILPSGGDVERVKLDNQYRAAFYFAIAVLLSVWGWNDWRRRNNRQKTGLPTFSPSRDTLRSEDFPYTDAPGLKITRNPYLPLVTACSSCSKEFRLHVNSAALEGFEITDDIGFSECPLCGAGNKIIPQNTRAVSFAEATQLPIK